MMLFLQKISKIKNILEVLLPSKITVFSLNLCIQQVYTQYFLTLCYIQVQRDEYVKCGLWDLGLIARIKYIHKHTI